MTTTNGRGPITSGTMAPVSDRGDFVLARIAERETAARSLRTRISCKVQRQLVRMSSAPGSYWWEDGAIVRYMANPHVEHPAFKEEWKP